MTSYLTNLQIFISDEGVTYDICMRTSKRGHNINTRVPLDKNILNTPMEIYVNHKYISNNYISVIRPHCGETEA